MKVLRITSNKEVVKLWPFFEEGILYEAKYLRYAHPVEVYRKILCHLVYKNPQGWVGVVFDGEEPVGFLISHEITPLFASYREFDVAMFYFRPGYRHVIRDLQLRLDDYCRQNGIGRYYITSSSFSSCAQKVFRDTWQGLERSHTVFKRKVL